MSVDGIVVPNATTAAFIKCRLLNASISLLDLHFWTPGVLRKRLLCVCPCETPIALREDLHLLMATAAKLLVHNPVAQSAMTQPESLVRALDMLAAAGWNASALPDPHSRELANAFLKRLDNCRLTTVQKVDDRLWKQTKKETSIFGNVLFYGFSSGNWDSIKILQAGVQATRESTLCFLANDGIGESSQAWQGSWEETVGAVQRLSDLQTSKPQPYLTLAHNIEFPEFPHEFDENDKTPRYLIGEDLQEEADAITAQALEFLVQTECARLGIVFANQTSLLAREIGTRLVKKGVPHYNALGHPPGKSRKENLFDAWVQWQTEAKLDSLFLFLEPLFCQGIIPFEDWHSLREACQKAFREVMTEEMPVIKAYLHEHGMSQPVEGFFQNWNILPQEAPFSSFLSQAKYALEHIGWPEDFKSLDQRAKKFIDNLNEPITRKAFLQWLRDVSKASGRIRSRLGSEAFSKVHLVTANDAIRQSWSHLILVGLNKGEWPQNDQETPFLSDKTILSLNQRVLQQGSQGEGQLIVENGFGLLTSKGEKYGQAVEIFRKLVGMPTCGLAVSAHLKNPLETNREAIVSDFLERLYWASEKSLLDNHAFTRLLSQNKHWLSTYCEKPHQPRSSDENAHQTLRAYKARRDVNTPFDEYSFGFNSPPPNGLNFPCKAWEEALKNPAGAWFNHVLGIKKIHSTAKKDCHALALGTWVHSWLSLQPDGQPMQPKPSTETWRQSEQDKAGGVRERVARAFSRADKKIPDWWLSEWAEARRIACGFVKKFDAIKEYVYINSEYSLPPGIKATVFDDVSLPLQGRIDLVTTNQPCTNISKGRGTLPLWIIDFKTGLSGPLTEKKLAKGDGLQLALYALAFSSMGYNRVSISILQPAGIFKRQLDLSTIIDIKSLWQGIAQIHKKGVLGQRGPLRSNYSFVGEYPLATLAIPEGVLAKKWQLTHPGIPL